MDFRSRVKAVSRQYYHYNRISLHGRSWISPWIKSMSSELDITIHVIMSQLSDHCGVISNRFWSHQRDETRASETRGRCVKIVVLSSFTDSLCHVRNKISYVLLWRTVSTFTQVLFWYSFPSLLRNEINTNITLSWEPKQFVTGIHTLLSISIHWTVFVLKGIQPSLPLIRNGHSKTGRPTGWWVNKPGRLSDLIS